MNTSELSDSINLKIDKTALSTADTFDDSDMKAYWHSRTPYERLQHIEILRRINYGDKACARLQRVLEITQCSWG